MAPHATHIPHWYNVNGRVLKKLSPNSVIKTCSEKVMNMMMQNKRLFIMPLNTFNSPCKHHCS